VRVRTIRQDPEIRRRQGQVAILKRHHPEKYEAAHRSYLTEKAVAQIEALVEAAPPLTDEQRERLRRLLAPVGGA
jgi:hypothetical protein